MTRRRPILVALLAVLLLAIPAGGGHAVQPDEMLDDPQLEQRAREISKGLRCLVCQNQSIDDSNADLARDLRLLVRERLKAGDSNEEVIDFVVARYGDFVLLEPPVKTSTYVLWYGPAAIALIAVLAAAFYFRRSRRRPAVADAKGSTQPPPLSLEERDRVRRLLDEADGADDGTGADGDGDRRP